MGSNGGRGIVGGGLTLIGAPAVRRRCKVGDGGEIGASAVITRSRMVSPRVAVSMAE